MPVYTYRREDGTTFDVKQKFNDEPLKVDPSTGQAVVRVVQSAGIIFKGSGFYVNDSKGAKSSLNGTGSNGKQGSDKTAESKPAESKAESKSGSSPAAEAQPATTKGSAAS